MLSAESMASGDASSGLPQRRCLARRRIGRVAHPWVGASMGAVAMMCRSPQSGLNLRLAAWARRQRVHGQPTSTHAGERTSGTCARLGQSKEPVDVALAEMAARHAGRDHELAQQVNFGPEVVVVQCDVEGVVLSADRSH